MEEKPAAKLLAPLVLAVPVVTLLNYVVEDLFARRWGRRWERGRGLERGPSTRRNAGCPRGGGRMTLPGHMLDYIATRDHRLMRRVHRWRPPRWFRLWMILATRGGDGWLWYALSALVLVFGGSTRYAGGDCGVDGLRRRGHSLSHPEENNGQEAAERAGAALLGHAAAA